jgi:pimeloyl-ACP methyl ester carboxylesterase
MSQIFDYLNPIEAQTAYQPMQDINQFFKRKTTSFDALSNGMARTNSTLSAAYSRRMESILTTHPQRFTKNAEVTASLSKHLFNAYSAGQFWHLYWEYYRDSIERGTLMLDTLRKRGDIFIKHEEQGCPPVLAYDYEVVMEGKYLPHPTNYTLLKILPPTGVTINESLRPYIIIDPRAGHGPGIGGFKKDSQVGVLLQFGHPVYFVSFDRMPQAEQYISSVTRSEAAFVREVMRLHPHAEKPVIIGNCQGGWGTLLLAATNPDLTGPIVINGAPVATWSGKVGENSMRYNAGVLGGTWIPMLLSDLGDGNFDGAYLVQNFELLNPGRSLFTKYTELYRNIDQGDKTFLDFETWWGGFFLLKDAEIRWIVEQLFIGNRLVKNEARIEPGRPIDLKAIRAPIIVFTSHGDNITPPSQALEWIKETYANVNEIKIRGKKIIYMVHDQVGHLGIFVSSQVAKREHSEVASVLNTIESLAPGLYEMRIEDVEERNGKKSFTVSFQDRTLEDIQSYDDSLDDEQPFAAVARASEFQAQLYEGLGRPFIKSIITPGMAELGRASHPQRLSRSLLSSQNPFFKPIESIAKSVKQNRQYATTDNPFLAGEQLFFGLTEQVIDYCRDVRDMSFELMFFSFWGSPAAQEFGKSYETHRTLKTSDELRVLPEVVDALERTDLGGFPEAVIRMLVMLADSRGNIRKDRLERWDETLNQCEPFSLYSADEKNKMIQEQTLIASFASTSALNTLPLLLSSSQDRDLALKIVHYITGEAVEMTPQTNQLMHRFHDLLEIEPFEFEIIQNPLTQHQTSSEQHSV